MTAAEPPVVAADALAAVGPRAVDVLPDGRIDHRGHDRDDQGGHGWVCLWCSTEDAPWVDWTIPYDVTGKPMPEDWRERPYAEVLALCGMDPAAGLLAATPGEGAALSEDERLIVGRAHDSGTWNDVLAGIEQILAARATAADPLRQAVEALADDCQHSRQVRGEDPVITRRDGSPADVEAILRRVLDGNGNGAGG